MCRARFCWRRTSAPWHCCSPAKCCAGTLTGSRCRTSRAYFVLAAAVLWHSYRHAESAILRQQMKWVTRGTILAVAPFTLFYVIPYLSGSPPDSGDEGLGAVAGVSAADLRLRHLPLPPDGRGPDLQARHGLHHRGGRDYRRPISRRWAWLRCCSTRASPASAPSD